MSFLVFFLDRDQFFIDESASIPGTPFSTPSQRPYEEFSTEFTLANSWAQRPEESDVCFLSNGIGEHGGSAD
ncbi:MAG: hypothetical protein AB9Q22_10595 [Candidatus Reddybacter sp.]